MPDIDHMIEELKNRADVPLEVVEPGKGLATRPAKAPKVVSNKVSKETEKEIIAEWKLAYADFQAAEGHRDNAVKIIHDQLPNFTEEKLWVEWGKGMILKADKAVGYEGRGERDVRKLIAMAKQDDPAAAREEEKRKLREAWHAKKEAEKEEAAIAMAAEEKPTTDPGNPTPKKLLKKIAKLNDEIEIFSTKFLKFKLREESDQLVTVSWTRDEWSALTAQLEKIRP